MINANSNFEISRYVFIDAEPKSKQGLMSFGIPV